MPDEEPTAATLELVRYEVDGPVALVILDRPEQLNALSAQMKRELGVVFDDLALHDDRVRAVVLTGAGPRAFSVGADIKERAATVPTPAEFYRTQQASHRLFNAIADFEKPVIAAINGYALGGGLELALCCDLRLAAQGARMGVPEVKLGVIPGAGGTQRLPRAIGEAAAKEMLFTGEPVDAERALALGLVSRVMPDAELLDEALRLAHQIGDLPALAVQAAKRAVNLGSGAQLAAGLQFEIYAASMVVGSPEFASRVSRFVAGEKAPTASTEAAG